MRPDRRAGASSARDLEDLGAFERALERARPLLGHEPDLESTIRSMIPEVE